MLGYLEVENFFVFQQVNLKGGRGAVAILKSKNVGVECYTNNFDWPITNKYKTSSSSYHLYVFTEERFRKSDSTALTHIYTEMLF